jgi:hypothetical protein
MSKANQKVKTALSWLAVLWLALLVTAAGNRNFSASRIRLYWTQAVAGPYDATGLAGVWTGHARGAAVAGLWMACAAGWGAQIAGFIRLGPGPFAVMAGWGMGMTVLGLAVFGLGVLGLLHPACLAVLLIPGVAGIFREPGRRLGGLPGALRPVGIVSVVAAAVTGVFLLAYLVPALAPELGWDALTYHLRVPSHYLGARRIYLLPFSLGSFYPFLAEMWVVLGQAFGGDSGAKLINYAFLPVTALILVAIGDWAGSRLAGWLAALIYVGMPASGMLAGQCYNDLEVAALGLLAIRAALNPGSAWGVAAAVLCGATLGCKYSGASIPLVCGIVWLARGGGVLRSMTRAAALSAVVLAVFAAWPLRDWLWTGNPVYPLMTRVFPETGWNPYFTPQQAASIVPVSAPRNPVNSLLDLVRLPADFSLKLTALNGVFTPLIVGLLPALLLPGARLAGALGLFWAGSAAAAIWVFSRAGDGRYLIPVAALLALPAAAGLVRLAERSRLTAVAAGVAVTVGLVIQGGSWIALVSQMYVPWRVATGLESRSTYLSRAMLPNYEYMPMAEKVNAALPKRARVLMFSDIVSYYIDRETVFDTQQVTPTIGFRMAANCLDPVVLRRRFRQLGLDYVLYSSRIGALEKGCKCLTMPTDAEKCYERFWRRYAEPMLECGSMRLMRLRTEAEAGRVRPAPFLIWPGIQDAVFITVEDARNAGDWKRAEAALKGLLRRVPDLAEARFKLAEVYLLSGRSADAIQEAEKARKLGMDSGAWWLLRGGVLKAAGDAKGAAEAVRKGTDRWPSPRAWALLASYLYSAGDLEAARRAGAEAMRLNPYDAAVMRAWAAVR